MLNFKNLAYGVLFLVVLAVGVSNTLFEFSAALFTILTLLAMLREKRLPPIGKPMAVLTLAYFLWNALSLTQTPHLADSLRGLFKVFRHLFLFYSVCYVLDSEARFKKIFFMFTLTAAGVALDGLFQGILGTDPLRGRPMTAFVGPIQRLTGPFHHANNFSAYLSFTIFLFLGMLAGGAWRVLKGWQVAALLAGFFAVFACLVGTYARGAWIAVGAAALAFALARKSKVFLGGILALGLATAFFASPLVRQRVISLREVRSGSVWERIELWKESTRMIRQSPWLGHGVNTYSQVEPLYKTTPTDFQYAHNGYLHMAAEIGLVGLGVFLGCVFFFWGRCLAVFLRSREGFMKTAGLSILFGVLAFLLHSATDTNLQSLLLVNLFWLAMGMGWSARRLLVQGPQ